MSSFPHSADSGDSSQSLLSQRQSELGSQYVVESGVFMSSFTATIFVAALVTTGLLMLTLLIALTVMLNSCQSSNSGILEHAKKSDQHDYCSLYIFHSELNNLEIEDYFAGLTPDEDGLDIILLDADDLLSMIGNFSRISSVDRNEHIEDIKNQAHVLLVRFYRQLRAGGWSLFLFTRKPSKHWKTTESTLTSSGYLGWSSLVMRSDEEIQMEDWEYLSNRRLQLHKQGFRIVGLISSKLDAFRGPHLGKRSFKLANIQYYEQGNANA